MCELAAIAGVDPEPRTLRELVWMAEAADRAHWNRTAALLQQTSNVYRDPDTRPEDPMKFFPWSNPEPKHDAAGPREPSPGLEAALEKMYPGRPGRQTPTPEG